MTDIPATITERSTLDVSELETKVKEMYRAVAETPNASFHFELGRGLALRLGYPATVLDTLPEKAVESFAGVGYFFDLADLKEGESVLDLGSGSGMDVFFAAQQVGEQGRVEGIDITPEQLEKAERLRQQEDLGQVVFTKGYIDNLPFEDESFDVVISNGVINLAPDKGRVFAEAARVLRRGGRLAIADIVTEVQLSERIACNADLWASCIGGASQHEAFQAAIERSGLWLEVMKKNPYEFLSDRARDATGRYGVKSVSILARKIDQGTPS